MNEQLAIDLIRHALIMAMWISLPLLVVLFLLGVVVSLVQTLTSIQDPSFGVVPRLAAVLVTMLIALPWMLTRIIGYTQELIGNLARYAP
jgi:flagellar biosynthesis protein FliQ